MDLELLLSHLREDLLAADHPLLQLRLDLGGRHAVDALQLSLQPAQAFATSSGSDDQRAREISIRARAKTGARDCSDPPRSPLTREDQEGSRTRSENVRWSSARGAASRDCGRRRGAGVDGRAPEARPKAASTSSHPKGHSRRGSRPERPQMSESDSSGAATLIFARSIGVEISQCPEYAHIAP